MIKIVEFLSSLKMSIVSGVCVAASLTLMLTHTSVLLDPAWGAVVISGFPIFYWAIVGVFIDRRIYTSLLIMIAMIASIVIGELFAAGEIALIMAIGGILEEKTAARARKGLKTLISLAPSEGRRIVNGREEMISVELIRPGDILRVLPGEAIPVDGEIISGDTSIDQSVMTGESLPVDKGAGDSVFCGSINHFGSIDISASKIGEDSSLQKLIRLVEEAEGSKAPMQRIVDKWASWLVPIALIIAVVAFFVTDDIVRAVTVLVVFCPCALVLATPTAIVAAIGQAARHGVLIKSGDALERMGKVDHIAFDKTGTLTYGNLSVSDVLPFKPGLTPEILLELTASAESLSEHPLAKSIVAFAAEQGRELRPNSGFKMIPGKGVSADIDGRQIFCGNGVFLAEQGISFNENKTEVLEQLRAQGKAVILVSDNSECLGLVALSDTLRESAKPMVEELLAVHASPILLTGDNRQTAEYFAEKAGIQSVHAELLPDQKVAMIEQLQRDGHFVCMIGDGYNDAPALKTAYAGVAMGGIGSDIAIEAADIALMGDDISKVPYLKRISNATVRLIKLNITLAMCVNFAAILLSVMGILTPVTGALWHNIGSVLVTLNAVLLYDRKYI